MEAIIASYHILEKTNSEVQIIGIVCTHGENDVERAVKFALAANHILDSKIPIFRGINRVKIQVKMKVC